MLILGHRGTGVTMRNTKAQEDARRKAGTQGPENTLKAFELALKGGADGLECDVFRTADADLAIIHDNKLGLHARGATSRVSDQPMRLLRQLDVGDGEAIPSLRDVFRLAARYNFPLLNIELAGKDTYRLAYDQARQTGYPLERIVFSSFYHSELAKLRQLDPDVKIGLLFEVGTGIPGLRLARRGKVLFSPRYVDSVLPKIKPTSLHLWSRDVTIPVMAYARRHGLELFIWTRQEKPPAQDPSILKLARQHKNAHDIHLITDYPAAIKAGL